jgi:hypothetical protein
MDETLFLEQRAAPTDEGLRAGLGAALKAIRGQLEGARTFAGS